VVPHRKHLLAHDGQRAEDGDPDQNQDQPVLGIRLAGLKLLPHTNHRAPC
jgi:hypothetical protein